MGFTYTVHSHMDVRLTTFLLVNCILLSECEGRGSVQILLIIDGHQCCQAKKKVAMPDQNSVVVCCNQMNR